MSNALSDRRRLAALRGTGLLDEPPSEALDRLTKLATRLLGVPISVVSLIEESRQFYAANTGVEDPWASQRGSPLSHSFCKHVVETGEPIIVEDAREHPLLRDNLAIPDMGVIAYAGVPLNVSGEVIGTFCAVETHPRKWSTADVEALRTLADAAIAELNLREATKLLADRERQLELLLDNSRELVCSFGRGGEITYVNRAWKETLGYSMEEATALRAIDLVAPEYRASFLAVVDRLRRGQDVPSYEAELIAKDGRRVFCQGHAVPSMGERGVVRIDALFFDVTAARAAEHARAAADKMKDELIGLVSHELRSPLTSIRGALKLMEAQPSDDPKTRQLTAMASRGADRLIRLVDDLLDVERAESGQLKLERREVAARQLFDDARDATAGIAAAAKIDVEFSDSGETVNADPDRIVQVLVNLIGNAVKFSPAGSEVSVTATRRAGVIRLSVRDQGRGIPADKLDTVFERFAQVAHEDGTKKRGAGLGLAICRAIVMQHGGRIWAENNPDRGASFHLELPSA